MTVARVPARVAVVIPCFNDGRFLEAALDSIAEAEPVEIVVVDDGSTDIHTLDVLQHVRSAEVRVVRQSNRGLSGARMAGLEASVAPYVFPLDADDLAVRGALASMADRLDAAPWADVCFGDYAEFGEHELIRAVPAMLDSYRLAYTNEYPVSALLRRSAIERVCGWRNFHIAGYEDWSLWIALVESGGAAVHMGAGVVTYRRRVRGERMLTAAKRRHPELYGELKVRHADFFARVPQHRRRSDLSPVRKALYPVLYGGRRRFAFEARIKAALDRLGIWTLRR